MLDTWGRKGLFMRRLVVGAATVVVLGLLTLSVVRPTAALLVCVAFLTSLFVFWALPRVARRARSIRRWVWIVGYLFLFVSLVWAFLVSSSLFNRIAEPPVVSVDVRAAFVGDTLQITERLEFQSAANARTPCVEVTCQLVESTLIGWGWAQGSSPGTWQRESKIQTDLSRPLPARQQIELPVADLSDTGSGPIDIESGRLTLEVPEYTLLGAFPPIGERAPIAGQNLEVVTIDLALLSRSYSQESVVLDVASEAWQGELRNRFLSVTAADLSAWLFGLLAVAVAGLLTESVRALLKRTLRRIGINWGDDSKAALQQADPVRILVLSADPTEQPQLRIGEETRRIKDALRMAKYDDIFSVEAEMSVRPRDILDRLHRHKPTILHFVGHGTREGNLLFESETGESKEVGIGALLQALEALPGTRSLILNACFSATQAGRMIEHVECVVGTRGGISDAAALSFADGFYRALGEGKSIKTAFELGKTQIKLEGLHDEVDLPVLVPRPGVNPSEMRFAPHESLTSPATQSSAIEEDSPS